MKKPSCLALLLSIFSLFSNRRGSRGRPVTRRAIPTSSSHLHRLDPDLSSHPSRRHSNRTPGVTRALTDPQACGRLAKSFERPARFCLTPLRGETDRRARPSAIDRTVRPTRHSPAPHAHDVLRAHLHRCHHRGPHAPAARRLRQPPAGAPPLPRQRRRARHAEPEPDPQRAPPALPALHHRTQHPT